MGGGLLASAACSIFLGGMVLSFWRACCRGLAGAQRSCQWEQEQLHIAHHLPELSVQLTHRSMCNFTPGHVTEI